MLLASLTAGALDHQAATVGQKLILDVTTSGGTKPLVYQWLKDGEVIEGQIGPSLVIPSLTPADAGAYRAKIGNAGGGVLTSSVVITIEAEETAPVIITDPTNTSAVEGQSVTFRSVAVGAPPLSYQWFRNGIRISGATTANYTISSATISSQANYSVRVTNAVGAAQSMEAFLEVSSWSTFDALKPSAGAPNQTADSPTPTQVFVNGSATLSASPVNAALGEQGSNGVFETTVGDFDYRLKVSEVTSESMKARAGIALRTLDGTPDGPYLADVSQNGSLSFSSTPDQLEPTVFSLATGPIPIWLRIARAGNIVRAYRSSDGNNWYTMGSASSLLPTVAAVGPWLHSNSNTFPATARFSSPALYTLPLPWTATEVGVATTVGSSHFENGTFVTAAAGVDIAGTADQFRYVYIPALGDCEIVARLTSLTNTNSAAKSGVMIRESLTPASSFVMVGRNPSGKMGAYLRNGTGKTATSYLPFVMSPPWVKIVRVGSRFSTYASIDGRSWSVIGHYSVKMTEAVYIGLASTSRSAGVLGHSMYNSVSVTP